MKSGSPHPKFYTADHSTNLTHFKKRESGSWKSRARITLSGVLQNTNAYGRLTNWGVGRERLHKYFIEVP